MKFNITGLPVLHYVPVCSNSNPLSPWCHPTISFSVIPFSCCLFQWFSSLHQVAKLLELQHQPSNGYSGLISFRIDWFDILTVQGTLRSLLQQHSWKPSILWHSPKSKVCFSNQWWVDSPLNSKSESQFLSILWLYHLQHLTFKWEVGVSAPALPWHGNTHLICFTDYF